eukprot:TRINITY_DN1465_c0_g1_i2.p1 TRINITY_DN1465_c0_g1~~TRINITY_DN1465_c0_g1_i2.p1  ORF type:complete len:226 (-),score=46.99 TRINITY_DN1465_c0_g1_i2:196-873(-)
MLTSLHSWFNAGLFLLLTVTLAVFSLMLIRMAAGNSAVLIPITSQPRASKPKIVVVTLVIMLMFSSRFVYNIGSALGIFNLYFVERMVTPEIFCFQVLWEVIPTMSVLLFFRQVPKTRLGLFKSKNSEVQRRLPSTFLNDDMARHSTNLINNPSRYDTDDEAAVPHSAAYAMARSPWSIWGTPPADSSMMHPDISRTTSYGTVSHISTPTSVSLSGSHPAPSGHS